MFMIMKNYLLQITVLISLLFTQHQCQSTNVTISPDDNTISTKLDIHNSPSMPHEPITSSPNNEITSLHPSAPTLFDHHTTTVESTSTFSSQTTSTSPSHININLIYRFDINSSSPLKLGDTTNSTILSSVQHMVISCFNLLNFNITVIRIEIKSSTKDVHSDFYMLTTILFQSSHTDCNITCIKANASSSVPQQSFLLPLTNDSLVNVTAQSGPQIVNDAPDTTPAPPPPAPINHKKGDSPPGTPARLGMGFGIPIITILIAIEIIYFYRKYGCDRSYQPSNHDMPSYAYPPAV